jgi:hypothetical protein
MCANRIGFFLASFANEAAGKKLLPITAAEFCKKAFLFITD